MDQAMFAVEAMHNYGRGEEAVESAYRLFDNAKGLLGDEPINENYNPETGDRLNATNFSWSSAAFYYLPVRLDMPYKILLSVSVPEHPLRCERDNLPDHFEPTGKYGRNCAGTG